MPKILFQKIYLLNKKNYNKYFMKIFIIVLFPFFISHKVRYTSKILSKSFDNLYFFTFSR